MKYIKSFPAEAVIWLLGLTMLAFLNPEGQDHFTICLFLLAGFDFCPGCGIGRAISHVLHGNFILSLKTHPLGIFALIILSYRIVQLSTHYLKSHGKSY